MVVSEVVGVGIFLSPATMVRTLGSLSGALIIWLALGLLSAAGALCYAELASRFPRAGGGYAFLNEAYGARVAFVYGWMALLVMDPGLAAALGIGLAQYLLATLALPASLVTPVAIGALLVFGLLTLVGFEASSRVIRWTAAAKLACVAVLVLAGVVRAVSHPVVASARSSHTTTLAGIAAAVIAAFFAFGGWWDVGRMSEEVEDPRQTMPRALIAGVLLVAAIYALVSVAFVLVVPTAGATSDEAFVLDVGVRLFGPAAGRLLALMVVVAVAGSLAAVLLGAPRLYVAMARDGLFPERLVRFNESRGTSPGGTLIQVGLACLLVALGTFNEILGYFVPGAVFFLGLSAAAILVVPRATDESRVFRAPLHPLPIVLFLLFITAILILFAAGQPRQTLLGALVVALGIPISFVVIKRTSRPGR
jgi:APA family basic amino acid/polyamine antiporter